MNEETKNRNTFKWMAIYVVMLLTCVFVGWCFKTGNDYVGSILVSLSLCGNVYGILGEKMGEEEK